MREPTRALWGPMGLLVAGARWVAYERVPAHSWPCAIVQLRGPDQAWDDRGAFLGEHLDWGAAGIPGQ